MSITTSPIGGLVLRVLAAVVLLAAAVVAWLRWPDPAVLVLALVTAALAIASWRAARVQRDEVAPRPAPVALPRDAAPGDVRAPLLLNPPAPPASLPSPAYTPPASFGEVRAAAPTRGSLRVLVAEDHDINRRLLAAVLESLGHRPHFAADGEAAVEAVRREPFDVVLMDLAMPRLDGLAATRAIRALPDSRQATLPIVALTADDMPQTRGRCLLAGMNDFLTKPIAADALAVCLRRLYGDAMQQRPPGVAVPAPRGEPALIDAATLNQVLASLPRDRVVDLIDQFFQQTPAQLQALRDAIRDAQMGALKVGAHGLRGAAANLGMAALAGTAGALHDGAAHLAAHEVALLLQRLERQLHDTRAALVAMGLGAH